jgi:ADP-ribose pyrophosphatase YjhB (NUDIX family)
MVNSSWVYGGIGTVTNPSSHPNQCKDFNLSSFHNNYKNSFQHNNYKNTSIHTTNNIKNNKPFGGKWYVKPVPQTTPQPNYPYKNRRNDNVRYHFEPKQKQKPIGDFFKCRKFNYDVKQLLHLKDNSSIFQSPTKEPNQPNNNKHHSDEKSNNTSCVHFKNDQSLENSNSKYIPPHKRNKNQQMNTNEYGKAPQDQHSIQPSTNPNVTQINNNPKKYSPVQQSDLLNRIVFPYRDSTIDYKHQHFESSLLDLDTLSTDTNTTSQSNYYKYIPANKNHRDSLFLRYNLDSIYQSPRNIKKWYRENSYLTYELDGDRSGIHMASQKFISTRSKSSKKKKENKYTFVKSTSVDNKHSTKTHSNHNIPRRSTCGACILSHDRQKCLIVKQREAENWSFPKGTIETEEKEYHCMLREVLEETGIDLKKQKYKVLGSQFRFKCKLYFIVLKQDFRDIKLEPRDTKEIETAEWIDIKNWKKFQLNRMSKETFKNNIEKYCKNKN